MKFGINYQVFNEFSMFAFVVLASDVVGEITTYKYNVVLIYTLVLLQDMSSINVVTFTKDKSYLQTNK